MSSHLKPKIVKLSNAFIEVFCDGDIVIGWDGFGLKCQSEMVSILAFYCTNQVCYRGKFQICI